MTDEGPRAALSPREIRALNSMLSLDEGGIFRVLEEVIPKWLSPQECMLQLIGSLAWTRLVEWKKVKQDNVLTDAAQEVEYEAKLEQLDQIDEDLGALCRKITQVKFR